MKVDHPGAEAYAAAAWLLDCGTRSMRAVGEVESGPHGAFLDSGEPTLLFERHLFHALTNGRFAGARVPGVKAPWAVISDRVAGDWGPVSRQHDRLAAAVQLDRNAALKSASWGLYQILGRNHEQAGYPDVQRFVNAMIRSVDDHLRAFVMFIRHDVHLVDAIRAREWAKFAQRYNGPLFARNKYAERMEAAYEKLA